MCTQLRAIGFLAESFPEGLARLTGINAYNNEPKEGLAE